MSKRTPGPWTTTDEYEATIPIDAPIESTGYDESIEICRVSNQDEEARQANAEFIVKACNSHDVLVGALKFALSRFEDSDSKWARDTCRELESALRDAGEEV